MAQNAKMEILVKSALEMHGPVIVGTPVDYRDTRRLLKIVRPDALD